MKKVLVIIAISLAVLIVALAATVALSPFFLNKYKGKILTAAGEAIHRDITMGDIRLTIFTGLGLRLTDVTVSNAKGFRKMPMLALEDFDVRVRFLPLLQRKIQVVGVVLKKPRIVIERNKKGVFNFSDIVGGSKKEKLPAKKEKEKTAAPALPVFLVSKISITDGEFSYYDATSEALRKGVHIKDFDLALGNVSLSEPMSVALSFGINQSRKDIRLKGTVGPIGEKPDVTRIPLSLKLTMNRVELTRFANLPGVKLPVNIESGALSMDTRISGRLSRSLDLSGATRIDSLTVKGEKKKDLVRGLNVSLEEALTVGMKKEEVMVKDASLTVDRAQIDVKGRIENFKSDPALSLKFSSNEIPLPRWEKVFPMLAGTVLGGSLSLKGNAEGTLSRKLKVGLDISSPNFSLDLPESEETKAKKGAKTKGAKGKEKQKGATKKNPPIPPLPQNLDAEGTIKIARGRIDKLRFSALSGKYKKVGSKVSLKDFSVKWFGEGGSTSLNVEADLGQKHPPFSLGMRSSRLALAEVQRAFIERKEKLEGELSAKLDISGAGLTFNTIKKTLKGKGDFKIEEGALTNVNLETRVIDALSKRTGSSPDSLAEMFGIKVHEKDRTPFEEFYGVFTIGSGKIRINDASIVSENHGFSVSGKVGLNLKLNLRARMILRKAKKETKEFTYYLVDKKDRRYVPFKVYGPAKKPKVKVDFDALLKGQAQRVIDKETEKLKKQIGPGGEDILKPLEKIFR